MFWFFLVPTPSPELFIGRKLQACVFEEYAAVPVFFRRCSLRDESRLQELCALRLMASCQASSEEARATANLPPKVENAAILSARFLNCSA